jgi:Nif-specific regulatory protein
LEELIQQKRFRLDLYYRLNVIRLDIPPLRERKEDILLLTKYFIEKYSKENDKDIHSITPEAIKLLESYDWPGNVRELENLIERAVVLNQTGYLDVKDFPEVLEKISSLEKVPYLISSGDVEFSSIPKQSLDLYDGRVYETVIGEVEKKLILYALKKFKYTKTKAAKFLGINRNTLEKRIKELKIEY